ncbi:MAG: hypothetical protein ICV68_04750 [Pyrinomonadaceae bacterium]|nr:hypothetical protein [Pyrinomonadaceae bacterium]
MKSQLLCLKRGRSEMRLRHIKYFVCVGVLFILALPLSAAAQTSEACPQIRLVCMDATCCGPKFEFVVHVGDGKMTGKLTYKWSVSASRISSGQGTRSIKVDGSKLAGQALTATVEIGGLAAGCEKTFSISQTICHSPLPTYQFFDSYSDISFAAEKRVLERFARRLREAPFTRGFIYAYSGRRWRAERAKKYLVGTRGIKAERIEIVEGGSRQDSTIDLHLIPPGTIPPEPYPPAESQSLQPGKTHAPRPQ